MLIAYEYFRCSFVSKRILGSTPSFFTLSIAFRTSSLTYCISFLSFNDAAIVIRLGSLESCAPPPISLIFRSEEHTSELQSLRQLACRLLLEKITHPGRTGCLHRPPLRPSGQMVGGRGF